MFKFKCSFPCSEARKENNREKEKTCQCWLFSRVIQGPREICLTMEQAERDLEMQSLFYYYYSSSKTLRKTILVKPEKVADGGKTHKINAKSYYLPFTKD